MKKALANFEGVVLSRRQMKAVKGGGITCSCDYGGGYIVSGDCSGPDVETCNSYPCSGGGTNTGCKSHEE